MDLIEINEYNELRRPKVTQEMNWCQLAGEPVFKKQQVEKF